MHEAEALVHPRAGLLHTGQRGGPESECQQGPLHAEPGRNGAARLRPHARGGEGAAARAPLRVISRAVRYASDVWAARQRCFRDWTAATKPMTPMHAETDTKMAWANKRKSSSSRWMHITKMLWFAAQSLTMLFAAFGPDVRPPRIPLGEGASICGQGFQISISQAPCLSRPFSWH